jgi:catalase
MANFQRDGAMSFFNQGSRPNYISSIDPIKFRERTVNLDKVHNDYIGDAVTFLSEIRAEDFNAPRNLWEKVFDAKAKERFISNVSGHMSTVTDKEIIKRQIAIFREVSEDLATRLEKATGVQGYDGIANMRFNGTHNSMTKDSGKRAANGMKGIVLSHSENNGAPVTGSHGKLANGNGHVNRNGVAAH